jgi:hypothetical protein
MNDLVITTRSAPRLTICSDKSAKSQATHFVRAYRQSPEDVYLQMRWKGRYVGVSLTFEEARNLGRHLIAETWPNEVEA